MGSRRQRVSWPVLFALCAYLLALVCTLSRCLRGTDGHLTYVLDDAYIHMAYAHHFLQHHTWGVTSHEFTSCSSSPMWVLLLAGLQGLSGMHAWAPLVLNLAAATGLIAVVGRRLGAAGFSGAGLALAVLVFVFWVGLVPLGLAGLEHVAHLLVSVLFLDVATRFLAGAGSRGRAHPLLVRAAALAFLLTGLRDEGIWLLAVVCALCVLRRRFAAGAMLAGMGLLPIVSMGLVARAHGWPFWPTSILLKASPPPSSATALLGFLSIGAYRSLLDMPALGMLVAACLALLLLASGRDAFWSGTQLMLFVTALTALLHVAFSTSSWYMRYEAYLIGLGLVALLCALGTMVQERGGWRALGTWLLAPPARGVACFLLALFAVLPLSNRAFLAWGALPASSRNIYEQQVQMGRFGQRCLPGRGIAANDIGALSDLADPRLVDVWGLGSLDVFKERMSARAHGAFPSMRFLADEVRRKNVDAIVVYDRVLARYGNPLSVGWVRAGSWTIQDNKVCADDEVAFWAPDSVRAQQLAAALKRFSPELPPTVRPQWAFVPTEENR